MKRLLFAVLMLLFSVSAHAGVSCINPNICAPATPTLVATATPAPTATPNPTATPLATGATNDVPKFTGANSLAGGGLIQDTGANGVTITQPTLGNKIICTISTATNDDPMECEYQNRVATTDATPTTIHTFTIPASTTVLILGRISARRTGGSAGTAEDGAAYEIKAAYKNVAGTATAIGSPSLTVIGESQAAWDVTVLIASGTVSLQVTGAVNNNVTWHMTAFVYPIGT